MSYGLSSFGYDARLADKFKVFTNVRPGCVVDPKDFDQDSYVEMEANSILVPPNSFALGSTIEYFCMPRDVMALCLGKSTYARCGININATPLEPGWEGNVTIEITNCTPLPARVYANEGICQIVFLRGEQCKVSYADRGGKYMHQRGVTLPKV